MPVPRQTTGRMPVPRRITGGMPCHRSHARLGDVPGAESNGGGVLLPGAAGSRLRAGHPPEMSPRPDFFARPCPVSSREDYISCRAMTLAARRGGPQRPGRTRPDPDCCAIQGRKAGKSPAARNIRSCPSYIELKKGADDGRNQSQADTRPGTAGVVRSLPPVAIRPIPGVPRRAGGPLGRTGLHRSATPLKKPGRRSSGHGPGTQPYGYPGIGSILPLSRPRGPVRPGTYPPLPRGLGPARSPPPPISTDPTTPLAIARMPASRGMR